MYKCVRTKQKYGFENHVENNKILEIEAKETYENMKKNRQGQEKRNKRERRRKTKQNR